MTRENIITVKTSRDSGNGSLRNAITEANGKPGSIIIIKSSVGKHIKLTSGALAVASNMKIINETGQDLRISSESNNGLFNVANTVTLFEINSKNGTMIVLTNGKATNGGAIYAPGTTSLVLENVITWNNVVANAGGAIYNVGHTTATNCKFKSNMAGTQGGAIYSGAGVTLQKSIIIKNSVTTVANSSAGAGIFVDNGDCILDESSVVDNHVSYDLPNLVGGSAGGISVTVGSTYIQNNSHVDRNSALNSGGVLEGKGDIYLTNNSSISGNRSFTPELASGGGGITITFGTVYVSNSEICDNNTVGMYSGGIVSLIGNVIVTAGSKIMRNSNRGPGGGIAVNVGSVTVADSIVSYNTGASLGGGIVTFTPSPAFLSITNSEVSNNILTNAQTIDQTIGAFIGVITQQLTSMVSQATLNGGSGGAFFAAGTAPDIIAQITSNISTIETIYQLTHTNIIGGGAIASLTTSPITIVNSKINNNFAGKNVSKQNYPFISNGGALYGYDAPIVVQDTTVELNGAMVGGGIFANNVLNVQNSFINHNQTKESHHDRTRYNGGGIHMTSNSVGTLIDAIVNDNVSKSGNGGGIYNEGNLTLISTSIKNNKAKSGGGIYSTDTFVNVNSVIKNNSPNDIKVKL